MSFESLKSIIGRAVTEPEYRDLLFSDPDKALEDCELSDEESAALKGLEKEKFESVAEELEERISKAGGIHLLMKDPGIKDTFNLSNLCWK